MELSLKVSLLRIIACKKALNLALIAEYMFISLSDGSSCVVILDFFKISLSGIVLSLSSQQDGKVLLMENMHIFNRGLFLKHRERAAKTQVDSNFLFVEIAKRLSERLDEIKRKFPSVLELGCRGGELSTFLSAEKKIKNFIQGDISYLMALRASKNGSPAVVCDEEYLPFKAGTFDAVLSNLSLHWVNDLPGTFKQISQILKPDGLFLASMLGDGTLQELRESLAHTEASTQKSISPRISPLADIKDLGRLLLRAGFKLPVLDVDKIKVSYSNSIALMHDLRAMGETNAVLARGSPFLRRDTLMAGNRYYLEKFGDGTGRIIATFKVITLVAWTPAPSQPKPLRPGEASVHLGDFLS